MPLRPRKLKVSQAQGLRSRFRRFFKPLKKQPPPPKMFKHWLDPHYVKPLNPVLRPKPGVMFTWTPAPQPTEPSQNDIFDDFYTNPDEWVVAPNPNPYTKELRYQRKEKPHREYF